MPWTGQAQEGIRHERTHATGMFEALDLPHPALRGRSQGSSTRRAKRPTAPSAKCSATTCIATSSRGWRITSPNLEQCGLLDIGYLSLGEFCTTHDEWRECTHPALACTQARRTANWSVRVLLDFMRRELAIRVSYLDPVDQESIRQLSRPAPD